MKIKLFSLRKNKKYNYTPRYYQGKEMGNSFEIDSKIRKDRENPVQNFNNLWQEARNQSRNKGNREINKTFLIVLAILLLITLYFLDFDLSIFLKKPSNQ